ncbi:Ubiquitin-conjugating enzyme E2 T, partial [Tieghemiomyces parasiticus]
MAAAPRQLVARLRRELEMLTRDPPVDVVCYPENDSLVNLKAHIKGPRDTPYEGGSFALRVSIPDRYPFEPPQIQFITQVYHPNIDRQGRICLDLLKMPPKGAWKPSLNVSTVLASLHLLLSEPNPNDPLLTDVAAEFKEHRTLFNEKARQCTRRYATGDPSENPAEDRGGAEPPAEEAPAEVAPVAPNKKRSSSRPRNGNLKLRSGRGTHAQVKSKPDNSNSANAEMVTAPVMDRQPSPKSCPADPAPI